MLRTALRPKWAALFVLLVVLVTAFVRLGQWQLDVARSQGERAALDRSAREPAVPLAEVLTPHTPFPSEASSRRITVAGAYASGQVLVVDRRLVGARGAWVVAPLAVDGGGTIGILRGFVPDGASAPPPPTGRVEIAGALAPGESPNPVAGLPAGHLGSVDLSVLVQRWPGELYNAFVFATTEAGPGVPAALGLDRVPPPPPTPEGLTWRNLAYALQWWVFAAFAIFMWVKMVRDEAASEAAQRAGASTAAEVGDNGVRDDT